MMGTPWLVLGAAALLVVYLGTSSRQTPSGGAASARWTTTDNGWRVVDAGNGVLSVYTPSGTYALSFRLDQGLVVDQNVTVAPEVIANILQDLHLSPIGAA